MARKDWVVYAKPPFAGPEQVIQYLGNYTHRIAISNHRIIKVENDHVYYRYRASSDGNKTKITSLHVQEFMRRFLLHVLPHRFVRLRSYGFLGNRFRKQKVARLKRVLLPNQPALTEAKKESQESDLVATPSWMEQLKQLTGHDLTLCSKCKKGTMKEVRVIESLYDQWRRHGRTHWPRKAWDTS